MKLLFLFVSVVCALALSALSIIHATGNLCFVRRQDRGHDAESGSGAETLSVFAGQKQVVDQLIDTLERERDLYRKKTAELAAREREIERRREIVAELRKQLDEVRDELAQSVVEVSLSEQANLKDLAMVYSKMEPGSAATLLRQAEPERAAVILNMIGDRQAAAILNAVVSDGGKGAEVAAAWADCIRRIGKGEKEG